MNRITTSAGRYLWMAFLTVLLAANVIVWPVTAQTIPIDLPVPLPGVTSYDETIPLPEAIIGHRIGTRHTTPDQVIAYFNAVAELSNRIEIVQHGTTYEGRPLIHAVVSSPSNHARLEAIRVQNVRLVEDAQNVSDDDIASMPAVFYAGYSIHGNEATGTEAAVLFLYHLAAGQGPAVSDALENVVILLDPMFNPDGRDRFTDWVNRYRGRVATSDTQDMEHNEPWPGGRTNHYFFDLNRDWLPAQQKESQGRVELFHTWKPQVLTDHHEMGGNSTFFFQPGIPSRTNPNTPSRNQELTARIGDYHAKMLDSFGALYYSQQSYDDFYYGKGSTYPDVNGAIGILFEQASSRALQSETSNGILTYAYGIRNQFATSLSSLKAIVELRPQLLAYQRDFYRDVDRIAKESTIDGYVISIDESRHRAAIFMEMLERHKIELFDLDRDLELSGHSFKKGDAIFIPTRQTQGRLVKAILEQTDTYQDSLFYDVSSWTLPLAFALEYAEVPKAKRSPAAERTSSRAVRGSGTVVGGEASYAYVAEWGEFYLPKLAYQLLEKKVRVQIMKEPFSTSVNGVQRNFSRGALIIPVHQLDVDAKLVHSMVKELSESDAITFYSLATGLTTTGPDLGSGSARQVVKPKVAILVEGRQSSSVAGEAWQLLSEHFLMPVSLLNASSVGNANLSKYNVLIVSGGGIDSKPIKEWVQAGGTLITLAGGTQWAASSKLVDLDQRPFKTDSLLQPTTYATLGDARGAQSLGGSIVEAVIDNTHPIMYGMGKTLPMFVRGTTVFDAPAKVGSSVASYSSRPELSGYFSTHHRELLPGGMAIASFSSGRGQIITFATDPNFRQFWYGTSNAFVNAVFLGSVI